MRLMDEEGNYRPHKLKKHEVEVEVTTIQFLFCFNVMNLNTSSFLSARPVTNLV